MLVNTLDLSGDAYDSFEDVSKNSTYYKDISLAQQFGVIMQYGGKFNPNSDISASEAIDFASNAAVIYRDKHNIKGTVSENNLRTKLNKDNKVTLQEASSIISMITK
jgi:hypothetical protein